MTAKTNSPSSSPTPSSTPAHLPGVSSSSNTKKVRRLKAQSVIPTTSSAAGRRRTVVGKTTEKESPPLGTDVDKASRFSLLKADFSMRIGSLAEARKSIIKGYLLMVLIPTVALLVMIFLLNDQDANDAQGLISSMNYMLMVIAAMGLPALVVFWAHGLFPKGSFGRFASGVALAVLLTLWLVFLLLRSDLQAAVADLGIVMQLDRVLALVCLVPIFYLMQSVSELIDERTQWRKRTGTDVKTVPLDLHDWRLDFNPRIGKLANGNSSAMGAYVGFLVAPTIVLVIIAWLVGDMNLTASSTIEASIGSMFGTVVLIGAGIVCTRFIHGFYPRGSLGRMVFGLLSVLVLAVLAGELVLGSGIETAFEQNNFMIDMSTVMVPVLMFIAFIAVIEVSELVDNRRPWHMRIGMPVEP